MKRIIAGENEVFFQVLRDLPYFQPTTNYYALAMRSFDNEQTRTLLIRDVSASPDSYQHFYITGSTTTESLSDAVIKLKPFGMYYYTLYPCTGSTLSDVDTSNTLEKGIIYLKES